MSNFHDILAHHKRTIVKFLIQTDSQFSKAFKKELISGYCL
jgi:hypothetical protein